jgi:hypothetical protein
VNGNKFTVRGSPFAVRSLLMAYTLINRTEHVGVWSAKRGTKP